MHPIAEVVFPLAVRRSFDYDIPEALRAGVRPGMRLRVPFGRQVRIGYCIGRKPSSEHRNLKPVLAVLDGIPVLLPALLDLGAWMARYYGCSVGDALESMLPAGIRQSGGPKPRDVCCVLSEHAKPWDALAKALAQKRAPRQAAVVLSLMHAGGRMSKHELMHASGASASVLNALRHKAILDFEIRSHSHDVDLSGSAVPVTEPVTRLSMEQDKVLRHIFAHLHKPRHQVMLIQGVTGSGKTEVYMRAIDAVLADKRQALMLVPEISLTPQTLARFQAKFSRIAILHSHLSQNERAHQWRQIREGGADVVIGARSAVFAPLERLGLIVVDEEQDAGFKQEQTPHYHGRDVAIMRAYLEKLPVILGSATPALESIHNVHTAKYLGLYMHQRATGAVLPEVRLLDLKHAYAHKRMRKCLVQDLYQEIRRALDRGEQAMLLLNRRGHSTYICCRNCAYVARCPHCEITMTFHRTSDRLLCHLCGKEDRPSHACPECASDKMHFLGMGTEKIEEEIRTLFPDARIRRMDSDTTRRRLAHREILSRFANKEIDILVGTQMIAKGLDFADVTVVGVISADVTLNLPDFRSAERTFQLLTQVIGRAGRGARPGTVMIQTLHGDHYAIAMAAVHDIKGFQARELSFRKSLHYPPFTRLIRFVISSAVRDAIPPVARQVRDILRRRLPAALHHVSMPCPAVLHKRNNRYRWHVLVKSFTHRDWPDAVQAVHHHVTGNGKVRLTIDVDPQSLL